MSEKPTCAERLPIDIWSGATRTCTKPPGHGKDGLYCKTHAAKHPPDDMKMVTMYIVSQLRPYISVIAVQSFTESTFVDGHGIRRNRRGTYDVVCATKKQAINELLIHWDAQVRKAKHNLNEAEQRLAKAVELKEQWLQGGGD